MRLLSREQLRAAGLSVEQAADQTVIDGKQIPLAFAPTDTAGYNGATYTDHQFGLTETITVIKTMTVTVVVPPTARADCAYW